MPLHEIFERQVRANPDHVALVTERESLTYRELSQRANRLARYLQRRGVGPESVVAIRLERSAEYVIALLGTLKAGGACMPLEPGDPAERISSLIDDADPLVILEPETNGWDSESPEPPACTATDANLAFIFSTSGSTGRPKGVMLEHRNFLCGMPWVQATFGLTADDRHLFKTSVSFVSVLRQLVWPLLTGGQVVVVPPDRQHDFPYLVKTAIEHGITIAHFIPSVLTTFLDNLQGARIDSLRHVICGGENLTVDFQNRLYAMLPSAQLHSVYALSEAPLVAHWCCERDPKSTAPLGDIIPVVKLTLLDGEIYLEGPGLARGYLNRPDLTSTKYLPNPLGSRLFRTADTVRRRADGHLEFVGRVDYMVKIRGFRVELGEIEAVMLQHPAVKHAVVIAADDQSRGKRLIAYAVSRGDDPISPAALRQHLKSRVPNYMVPAAFVILPALPLKPNGKIDRDALPLPDQQRPDVDTDFVAPRTEREAQVAAIWASVLGLPSVGIHDDFFDLGGHSLDAARLLNEMESRFGLQLSLADFLESSTIERLCRLIDGRRPSSKASSSSLAEIQRARDGIPFFCVAPFGGLMPSYAQQRFLDLALRLGDHQGFYSISSPALEKHATADSMVTKARQCIELLHTVQSDGPYFAGGWCSGGVLAFEIAQQLRARGEDVATLVLLDSAAPVRAADGTRVSGRDPASTFFLQFIDELTARDGPSPSLPLPATEQQWQDLLEQLRALSVMPPDSTAAMLRSLYRMFRTSMEATAALLDSYSPHRYSGDVVQFRAAGGYFNFADPALGWTDLCERPVTVHEVPGGHVSMLNDPHVDRLAALLRPYLQQPAERSLFVGQQ